MAATVATGVAGGNEDATLRRVRTSMVEMGRCIKQLNDLMASKYLVDEREVLKHGETMLQYLGYLNEAVEDTDAHLVDRIVQSGSTGNDVELLQEFRCALRRVGDPRVVARKFDRACKALKGCRLTEL
jgi:hypothetical protein